MVQKLEDSERGQVLDILREEGPGKVVTLITIHERAPWLHLQRISASLYTFYKSGDLSLHPEKGPNRRNQYVITEQINEDRKKTGSTIEYHQKGERQKKVVHPEEDSIPPDMKSDAVDALLDAASMAESNYIENAMEKTREAFYILKKSKQ